MLTALSPLDGRYQRQTAPLGPYFSELALMRYRVQVEVEYFIALCELPLPQLAAVPASVFPALRGLYERTSPRLFGLALRVVRQREWAEDVLQEAFITIWRVAPDYRATLSPPLAWMGLIVRSRALDLLRRRTADRAQLTQEFDEVLADTLESDARDPMDLADASEQAWALRQCLQQLEGPQREVVSLAYLRDLSHSELSEQLKLPLGTVKTWIRRGLEKLRVCMTRYT